MPAACSSVHYLHSRPVAQCRLLSQRRSMAPPSVPPDGHQRSRSAWLIPTSRAVTCLPCSGGPCSPGLLFRRFWAASLRLQTRRGNSAALRRPSSSSAAVSPTPAGPKREGFSGAGLVPLLPARRTSQCHAGAAYSPPISWWVSNMPAYLSDLAAGKTGKECVKRLAAAGYTVRATTRGESSLEKLGVSGSNVQLISGVDVTKPESLGPALSGAGAVIFTSSASKQASARRHLAGPRPATDDRPRACRAETRWQSTASASRPSGAQPSRQVCRASRSCPRWA